MRYAVTSVTSVEEDLEALKRWERVLVLEAIAHRLAHDPFVESRQRTNLRPNVIAPWCLRIGFLRVFYELHPEKSGTVRVLAVGKKFGNVLRIRGRKVTL